MGASRLPLPLQLAADIANILNYYEGATGRNILFDHLAVRLHKNLETMAKQAAAGDLPTGSGVGKLDSGNMLGVDFLLYVESSIGRGVTESEQAAIVDFRQKFLKHIFAVARKEGRDYSKGAAPVGKPGILDQNTYGIRYK